MCLPTLLMTFPLPMRVLVEDFLRNMAAGTLPSSPHSLVLDTKMQMYQEKTLSFSLLSKIWFLSFHRWFPKFPSPLYIF